MSQTLYSADHLALLTTALGKVGMAMADLDGKSFGPDSHSGAMVISSDPTQDNLGSRLITIDSVQQLKQIAGISDDHFEALPSAELTVRYPDPPVTNLSLAIARARADNCALESLLHPDDIGNIDLAMLAYVNGNSAKVAHYEPVINALRFPAQALVTVGADITVSPGNPLIIGPNSPYLSQDPVLGALCVFGTITILPGGQIQILIPVTIKAAKIISN
jgi:hypothetical protein